jgi:hypothetical protein
MRSSRRLEEEPKRCRIEAANLARDSGLRASRRKTVSRRKTASRKQTVSQAAGKPNPATEIPVVDF